MEDIEPGWTRWVGLVLGYQALVLFDVSSWGAGRPVVWWVATAVLALGVVRVTSQPGRAPRWWLVAVLVGPAVWVIADLFGSLTTVRGPIAGRGDPGVTSALAQPAWVDLHRSWAYLSQPRVLVLPSLVALGLRWPEAARWSSRRWAPAVPRVAVGAVATAVVAWLAMPRAVFDALPLVAVCALVPTVVAAGRGVTRPWARWVGASVGLAYGLTLITLDALSVEGGLSPLVEVDLPAHPTAEAVVLALVGWVAAATTIRVRERLTSPRHP